MDIDRLRQLSALHDLSAARELLRHAQRTNDAALFRDVMDAAHARDPALYREALQPLVIGGHIEAQIQSLHGDWPYQGGLRTNGGNHLWFDTRQPDLLTAARGDIDGLTVGDVRAPVEWTQTKHHALNCAVVVSVLEAALRHFEPVNPEVEAWVNEYREWALKVPQPVGRGSAEFAAWQEQHPLEHTQRLFPHWVYQVASATLASLSAKFISRLILERLPVACDGLAERAGGMRATTAEIYHARFMLHGREALLRLLFVVPPAEE